MFSEVTSNFLRRGARARCFVQATRPLTIRAGCQDAVEHLAPRDVDGLNHTGNE